MNTYLTLIEKTINPANTGLPVNPFDPLYCYYNRLTATNALPRIQGKLADLHYTLEKPYFITASQRETLLDSICIIQRRYWALSRFATICRNKLKLDSVVGSVPVAISVDLYMNDINPAMKNVVVIRQNDKDYYFTIRDLMNIINKNLMNSDSFFPKPLPIKNPYNNIAFTSTQLYNIYFAIRSSHYVMPELFQGFFLCNFAIKDFCVKYESIMRIMSIRNYVYNSHHNVLYPHVIILCFYHNLELYDNIHDDFPKDVLVKIFRPFIYLYLMVNYGLQNTLVVDDANDHLKTKLQAFFEYNPLFGRVFIKYRRINGRWKPEYTYNEKHMNFADL